MVGSAAEYNSPIQGLGHSPVTIDRVREEDNEGPMKSATHKPNEAGWPVPNPRLDTPADIMRGLVSAPSNKRREWSYQQVLTPRGVSRCVGTQGI